MQIAWKGQTCVVLTAQKSKQEQVRFVIDPFEPETGLKPPAGEADIVLVTNEKGGSTRSLKGDFFVVSNPGEYEVKGVFVQGIASNGEKDAHTIYTIRAEGIRLCHLGMLSQKELTPSQVEQIGNVDILCIPVGGGASLDGKEAAKIVSQIEPRLVVPVHHAVPKLKEKLDTVDEFLKVMGVKNGEVQQKLSLKPRDLTGEETQVVVLSIS